MERGLSFLIEARAKLPDESISPMLTLSIEEARLGIDLSIFAFEKALAHYRREENRVKKFLEPKSILEKYESLWLARARPGGLPESLKLLKEALSQDS